MTDSKGKVDNLHLQSAVVLFLVALPLNLGVAASSGVPAYLGIVSGVIGSLLVGLLSGAPLMVSGPDAGIGVLILEMINEQGIQNLGVIVVLSGVVQVILGLVRGAIWFRVFSPSVVNGMLAGMGMIIILSQVLIMLDSKPHTTGVANLAALPEVLAKSMTATEGLTHHPAACIGLLAISVALLWAKFARGFFKMVPPALPAIIIASLTTAALNLPIQLIEVPDNIVGSLQLTTPVDLMNAIGSSSLWICAFTLAFVASAQSLLTATAIDQLGKEQKANLDRELLAQGIGNIVCGMLGSLPVAGVLLRSMANIQSGSKNRFPNIIHGALILTA
ncbi:MAG: SulP family inorganic anion transporter, partial [Cyanobacteria bacterium]|nr:SulP family inorganic anion transporter [Cyanobacteriota bacterium]